MQALIKPHIPRDHDDSITTSALLLTDARAHPVSSSDRSLPVFTAGFAASTSLTRGVNRETTGKLYGNRPALSHRPTPHRLMPQSKGPQYVDLINKT